MLWVAIVLGYLILVGGLLALAFFIKRKGSAIAGGERGQTETSAPQGGGPAPESTSVCAWWGWFFIWLLAFPAVALLLHRLFIGLAFRYFFVLFSFVVLVGLVLLSVLFATRICGKLLKAPGAVWAGTLLGAPLGSWLFYQCEIGGLLCFERPMDIPKVREGMFLSSTFLVDHYPKGSSVRALRINDGDEIYWITSRGYTELPKQWHKDLMARVKWERCDSSSDDEAPTCRWIEKGVPVPEYHRDGYHNYGDLNTRVHILEDDKVLFIVSDELPGSLNYPGPAYPWPPEASLRSGQ